MKKKQWRKMPVPVTKMGKGVMPMIQSSVWEVVVKAAPGCEDAQTPQGGNRARKKQLKHPREGEQGDCGK